MGVGKEESRFDIGLATDEAWIEVRMKRDPVKGLDWAAVLVVSCEGSPLPVCLFDNAHGYPEMHRYREGVKLAGEPVPPRATAREDLPAAIAEIKRGWRGMVERWER